MKTFKSIFAGVIETIGSIDDIKRGLAGNQSNLFCDVINSHDKTTVNNDVAEFIKEGVEAEQLDIDEIASILDNPDWIVEKASERFRESLAEALQPKHDVGFWRDALERADNVIANAKSWFDAWGNFYVFAEPWSNACTRYYIIRSDSEPEALEELITRFEEDFISDDEDENDDQMRNDNGTAVNVDNVQLLASFKIEK